MRLPLTGPALRQTAHIPIALDVLAARGGDRAAARRLYDAHVDSVFAYCYRFARGDRALAADLAQESFVTAWQHLDDLREPERFSGWLKIITRRTCLQWAARRKRERAALEKLHAETIPENRTTPDAATVVARVIADCPDASLRQVAELFYIDPGHTTEAIAQRLNLTRTAITTRLYRFRVWAKRRMLGRLAEALEEGS